MYKMRDKHGLMRNRVAYEEGQNNACTVGGNMRKANRLPAARVYCKEKKKPNPSHFANSDRNSLKVFAKWRATVRSPWTILFSPLPAALEL